MTTEMLAMGAGETVETASGWQPVSGLVALPGLDCRRAGP